MVERYIRIWQPSPGKGWRQLAEKVQVLSVMAADIAGDDSADSQPSPRTIFQIRSVEGLTPGCKVGYLGQNFLVRRISDASSLRGLELICEAEPGT